MEVLVVGWGGGGGWLWLGIEMLIFSFGDLRFLWVGVFRLLFPLVLFSFQEILDGFFFWKN